MQIVSRIVNQYDTCIYFHVKVYLVIRRPILNIKQFEDSYNQMNIYKKQIVKTTKPPMENM